MKIPALLSLALVGCGAPAVSAPPSALPREIDAFMARYATYCEGPEGLTDCNEERFEVVFAEDLPWMRAHRAELVAAWIRSVEAGGHSGAYGLAWAGATEALPALREGLLADRYFYGWETDRPDALDTRMADLQYPHHRARIEAIERLDGRPIAEAVALTDSERAALVAEAYAERPGPGGAADVARWLVITLSPSTAEPRSIDEPAPASFAAPSGLDGYIVAVRESSEGHHDGAILARVGDRRVEQADRAVGCRVLPGAQLIPTDPSRGASIPLPSELFSNEANECVAEWGGLRAGDFAGTVGFSATALRVPLDDATRRLAEGMGLEALWRTTGADPADFRAEARSTAVQLDRGARVFVEVDAELRGDGPCGSPRCRELRQPDPGRMDIGPEASLVAAYDIAEPTTAIERLVVPSRPSGCSDAEHLVVRLADVVSLPGREPLVLVTRVLCDGWGFELWGTGEHGAVRVAQGAGGNSV